MKKLISIFIILIHTSLYSSSLNDPRWQSWIPRTPRLCHANRQSGFNEAYRKKIGNEYLQQMIADQKREAKASYDAQQAKLQSQDISQNAKHNHTVLIFPNASQLPVTPRRTPPSCTHLRTPRNATEIQTLLTISTIFPPIIQKHN